VLPMAAVVDVRPTASATSARATIYDATTSVFGFTWPAMYNYAPAE
jgi:hypothetical protein